MKSFKIPSFLKKAELENKDLSLKSQFKSNKQDLQEAIKKTQKLFKQKIEELNIYLKQNSALFPEKEIKNISYLEKQAEKITLGAFLQKDFKQEKK